MPPSSLAAAHSLACGVADEAPASLVTSQKTGAALDAQFQRLRARTG